MSKIKHRRIVFVINHAAFFISHRLPIAIAALERGWEVTLITGRAGSAVMEADAVEKLKSMGIPHLRTQFSPSGINPLTESMGALNVLFALFFLRPDVVHCASPKGIVIGGICARLCMVRRVVLAVSGLGFAFTEGGKHSIARRLAAYCVRLFGRFAMCNARSRIVVQNDDDFREIARLVGPSRIKNIHLVPGSGVDVQASHAVPMPKKEQIVVFPGRVIRDKGVAEFAEAAKVLRKRHPGWSFIVAGSIDYDNPSAISRDEIERWKANVEFVGYVPDIAPLMAASSIVCLPSYREGMPKALLDAAAWGCAVVTTDVPGCRDAIEVNVSGLLVPARDVPALIDALETLIKDPKRRAAFGTAGRQKAEREFTLDKIVDRLIALYD